MGRNELPDEPRIDDDSPFSFDLVKASHYLAHEALAVPLEAPYSAVEFGERWFQAAVKVAMDYGVSIARLADLVNGVSPELEYRPVPEFGTDAFFEEMERRRRSPGPLSSIDDPI